jgi:hypothetical protein
MRAVSERFAALIPHVNRWTTEVEWSNDGFATFDTAGVPLEQISQLVGHSGTTVTELVYLHQLRPVIQTRRDRHGPAV